MSLHEVLTYSYQVVGIVSSIGALFFAAKASYQAKRAEHEARTIHLQVNSRMDELLAAEKENALKRGAEAERARIILERLESHTEAGSMSWKLLGDILSTYMNLADKAKVEDTLLGQAIKAGVDIQIQSGQS
jgi:hypothetical protein